MKWNGLLSTFGPHYNILFKGLPYPVHTMFNVQGNIAYEFDMPNGGYTFLRVVFVPALFWGVTSNYWMWEDWRKYSIHACNDNYHAQSKQLVPNDGSMCGMTMILYLY